MELWICKHGESVEDLNKIVQGQRDGELTEKGIIQSRLLAFRLSFATFIQIFSSDLGRAAQTTKEIALYQPDAILQYESTLREKSSGILEGKTLFEYRQIAKKKARSLRGFRPIGGENWFDVLERSHAFINELITKYVKKDYIDTTDLYPVTNNSINNSLLNKSKTNQSINSFNSSVVDVDVYSSPVKRNETITPAKNLDSSMIFNGTTGINISSYCLKNTAVTKVVYFGVNKSVKTGDYTTENLENLFSNTAFQKKMSSIYRGFVKEITLPRILIISHGGFIMEFLNSIRRRKNIPIKFANETKYTGLYVIKIYCGKCGGACFSQNDECRLEYDIILFNDTAHLGDNTSDMIKIK